MYSKATAFLLSAALVGASPASGQSAGDPGWSESGSELTVYVMTMGPGDAVYERFGHNAIRVHDAARGTDVAYNYGMFSFDQENFLLRFIRGHMDYWMEGFDAALTASAYIRDDRSVWVQELNLSPAQRAELRDFLEWNALPENRVYRYDYYRDNCSTRVRDAIDLVLGGQIRAQTGAPSGTTYRFHTRRLTYDDPLIYAGLMAGLGQPVDREISVWEEMFLPMQMRERLRELTIDDGAGGRVPLVRSEQEIYVAARPPEPAEPPSRLAGFALAGFLLGGVVLGSAEAARRSRAGRGFFAFSAATWTLVAGTLGLVLFGLWAFTDHATSYRNENLFFFNPLLLGIPVLLPGALRGREQVARKALVLALVVAAIGLAGVLLQLLPALYQATSEMIALAVPVHLALALGLWRLQPTPAAHAPRPTRRRAGGEAVATRG
jgi:hypothetical protein